MLHLSNYRLNNYVSKKCRGLNIVFSHMAIAPLNNFRHHTNFEKSSNIVVLYYPINDE